jgi:predicted Ser/Thr protein kinase
MQAGSDALGPSGLLADFQIIRELGKGGMGVVYLAKDERLGRKVALKVIAPHLAHDQDFRTRFEAEARHAAAIDHPNAVSIYSAGSVDGCFFIVMRYVQGSDLRRLLTTSGPLEIKDAVMVTTEVAAALDAAHAAGLIHRDVKPANILITGLQGKNTSYLTDFGLTRNLSGSGQLTRTGQWIGTLDYVAPEQMAGDQIDARADIYALGCVLYEMVAGTVPFPGDEMHKLWSKAHADLPPLLSSGGTHPLDPVIRRATARNPDDRFRSAGDLARAAAAAIGSNERPTERSVATGSAAILVDLSEPVTATMPQPTTMRPTAAAPHEVPLQRGSRGRSVAIVLASIIVGAGLVLAALLATREGGGSHKTAATPRTGGGERAAGASQSSTGEASDSTVPAEPTVFEGAGYTVEIPADWIQLENEKVASDGSYVENKWRSPNGREEILIDESAEAPADPAESAAVIGEGVSEAGETVYSITDGVVHGGVEGSELDFRANSGLPERADFFFNLGNAGFAVLSSGYDLTRVQGRLDPVVSSLQPYP